MPIFDEIAFGAHTVRRMRKRGLSRQDVGLVLRAGEGYPDAGGQWKYELAVDLRRDC